MRREEGDHSGDGNTPSHVFRLGVSRAVRYLEKLLGAAKSYLESSVSLSHRSSDVWYILSPRRFERLGRQEEHGSEALVDEIPARREIEIGER